MNPGLGVWSDAIYNEIKPKNYTMLETDTFYHPLLEEFCKKNENAHVVKLNGHDWPTYTKLANGPYSAKRFPPNYPGFKPKKVPMEDGLNKDLLVVGTLQPWISQRLTSQFINAVGLREWVQEYGRVRFILWLPDLDKERLLPKSIPSRLGPSVVAEMFCDITELCSSGSIRTGKGFQSTKIKYSPKKSNIASIMKKADLLEERTERWIEKKKIIKPESHEWADKYLNTAVAKEREWLLNHIAMTEGIYLGDIEKSKYAARTNKYLRKVFRRKMDNMGPDARLDPVPAPAEKEFTPSKEEESLFSEFEEMFESFDHAVIRKTAFDDDAYARTIKPPLLQAWRQEELSESLHPFKVKAADFMPQSPLALIDFQPNMPNEYFRSEDISVRRKRFETLLWLVRTMFNHRAKKTKFALKMLAPGAENLLEDIPNGTEIGKKSVRVLNTDEITALVKAWDEWDFKLEGMDMGVGSRSEMSIHEERASRR
jgi:hypothetical protein